MGVERTNMVYCTKCGAKNPDDAKVCTKCGEPLYPEVYPTRRPRAREECFGFPRGGTIVSLFIGLVILLSGLIWILREAGLVPEALSVGPFIVIIIGILVIVGALYGLRRRY